jgi:Haem-NO-binding
MKGVVLAEFVQFAESRLGVPPPPAPPDALGTYPFADLAALVDDAAGRAGMPADELLRTFGVHLFGRFAALYPIFFFGADSALDFLGRINTYVHGEVQKLYPDAEFPHFDVTRRSPTTLELVYRSSRPLADLADGLIHGCLQHFGEAIAVRREDVGGDGREARFVLEAARPGTRRRERP